MQAFVEYIVKGLVDEPEAVTVTPVEREGSTTYELRLAEPDVAKVIGRQGSTIQAIRSLVQTGGGHQGKRCTVEIIED